MPDPIVHKLGSRTVWIVAPIALPTTVPVKRGRASFRVCATSKSVTMTAEISA